MVGVALMMGAALAVADGVSAQSGPVQRQGAEPQGVEAFWSALGDPVLDRLIGQALSANPQIRAATARKEGAEASRDGSVLDRIPVVQANAGYARQQLASSSFPGSSGAFPAQDVYSSGLSASWDVDLFGRLRGDVKAQDAFVSSADQDVRSTRVALAAQVARSYFDLRGAQNRLDVARRNAANQKGTLDLTTTRLDAGRGNELDVERAKAQLAFTEAAIPLLEAQAARAANAVAALVGRPGAQVAAELAAPTGPAAVVAAPGGAAAPTAPVAGAASLLPTFPDLTAANADQIIQTRPDLLSARQQVAASEALSGSARADLRPRVSLAANAGYAAPRVDAFGNDGTFNYRIGAVVSWAAFDIGHVKARVEQAEAFENEANARYEQAELRAREQLASAETTYQSARARVAKLRDAAAASERASQLASLRYEGGIADFLQVLDTQRTLLAAQDLLAQAEAQAADAYVSVFEARGGVR